MGITYQYYRQEQLATAHYRRAEHRPVGVKTVIGPRMHDVGACGPGYVFAERHLFIYLFIDAILKLSKLNAYMNNTKSEYIFNDTRIGRYIIYSYYRV